MRDREKESELMHCCYVVIKNSESLFQRNWGQNSKSSLCLELVTDLVRRVMTTIMRGSSCCSGLVPLQKQLTIYLLVFETLTQQPLLLRHYILLVGSHKQKAGNSIYMIQKIHVGIMAILRPVDVMTAYRYAQRQHAWLKANLSYFPQTCGHFLLIYAVHSG